MRFAALVFFALLQVEVRGVTMFAAANPIRKVVNMLKMIQGKIVEEGNKSESIFEKFMCDCKAGDGRLRESIKAADEKIPQLESRATEAKSTHQQLSQDLQQHKKDRADAKDTVSTAQALREKEAAAHAKDAAMTQSNIDALGKAIAALIKGGSVAGFLQTDTAAVVQKLAMSVNMDSSDREVLTSFLDGEARQGDAPQGGEITGILKQMKDEMAAYLAEAIAVEEEAAGNHISLVDAKEKEIAAAGKAVEQLSARLGDLAVEMAELGHDLEDTNNGLADDQKFLTDFAAECERKKAEWTEYQKTQAEENQAISETIKVLIDDDALELFRKTLPSPREGVSFVQLSLKRASAATIRGLGKRIRAAEILGPRHRGDHRLELLEIALRGRTAGFSDVIANLDKLVALLKEEQKTDDDKKVFCERALDVTEDEKKAGDRAIADRETVLAQVNDTMLNLETEIHALVDGVRTLDEKVVEFTQLRKEEHAQNVEAIASSSAAKDLLEVAKNRLLKFYNEKLYKAPKEQELSEQVQIVVNMGGESPPTPAPGGIAGTGIYAPSFVQVRQAPEADLSYKRKTQDSQGIIAMVDLLRGDLANEITETQTSEKNAQASYEDYVKDSNAKRATDSKAIANKEVVKGELEGTRHKNKEFLRSETKGFQDTVVEFQGLHGECDWLLVNHKLRKDARVEEADALEKAKSVLSGADYS